MLRRRDGISRLSLLVGVLVVLPLVAVDPAMVALLVDVELLAAFGGAGLLFLRGEGRLVVDRLATSLPVLEVRAGWGLTREDPGSLLRA